MQFCLVGRCLFTWDLTHREIDRPASMSLDSLVSFIKKSIAIKGNKINKAEKMMERLIRVVGVAMSVSHSKACAHVRYMQ